MFLRSLLNGTIKKEHKIKIVYNVRQILCCT